MMSNIMDRLKKSSKIKETTSLDKSIMYSSKSECPTSVPMINVALSGDPAGGLTSGLTVLAGPSKHFKTSFALLMAAAYLKQNPDAMMLFYDSEFGSPQAYFESFGIDVTRVLHSPIPNIEELKFDLMTQLEEIKRDDKVIIVIDSIGNLASKKEMDDALDGKSVADMTRAKQLKSVFRMATPYLTMRDIPMLAINHTYQTQEMFSKQVVSGGTGIMYSSDNVWIIGRRQEKEGKEIIGYEFIINIEKSRFVKEKSKIPIAVSYDGGIMRWSGLLELATEGGFVGKPNMGFYQHIDPETGEMIGPKLRAKATMNKEFWEPVFEKTDFREFLKKKYTLGYQTMMSQDEDNIEETEEKV